MSKGTVDSKIPILGKGNSSTGKPLSRLASFSNKVRAHLTSQDSSKLIRPSSGMLLGFLSPNGRNKNSSKRNSIAQRPSGFYQPLVTDWGQKNLKSEGCSPNSEDLSQLCLGRRVVVAGGKVGVLKFFGKTSLGDGNWCGVVLDRPDGQCDGSVSASERYFTCSPLYGLIVPECKVSLLTDECGGVASDSEETNPSSAPLVPSRPPSQISTPGSSSLPLFELPPSSRHSSVTSLVPKGGCGGGSVQSKHSSFELDESLGILTPDQISDFTLNGTLEDNIHRTPSAEELSSFMLHEPLDPNFLSETILKGQEEPLAMCDTTFIQENKDVSEDIEISDCVGSKKTSEMSSSFRTSKKDNELSLRTPSLEDLPLDAATEESKSAKHRTIPAPNSFITSITSITSLDNGYQGDGEWSRPGSRGPEHSPSAQQKGPKVRLDPMTDSDFFTESDADMHEEFGGHRRAQVIDGTLYNALPAQSNAVTVAAANAPRFSPPNEEMDSSGIYSDFDKKGEDVVWDKRNFIEDERAGSPEGSIMTVSSKSDQSLKKVSPTNFSQLISEKLDTIKNLLESHEMALAEDGSSEAKKPRSSLPSTKIEISSNKKYKMPKRNVASKIKTMMTTTVTSCQQPSSLSEKKADPTENQENRVPRPAKKGRWDAVMNKIAQGQADERTTPKIKEVKSRVYQGINAAPPGKLLTSNRPGTAPPSACRKASSTRSLSTAQSISTRSLRDISSLKTKCRRSRIRSSESSLQAATPNSQASSRNSSISDLSQPKPATTSRNSKKREARCTSPLSDGSTHSARTIGKTQNVPSAPKSQNNGKNVGIAEKPCLSARKSSGRRNISASKPQPLRDHNRVSNGSGGGGKTTGSRSVVAASADVNGSIDSQQHLKNNNQPLPPLAVTQTLQPPVNSSNNNNSKQLPSTTSPTSVTTTTTTTTPDGRQRLVSLYAFDHASKGAEALAVLVNHLVFQLDAFSAPRLNKEVDRLRKDLKKTKEDFDECQLSYTLLNESYNAEKEVHDLALEEAYKNYEKEKDELRARFSEEYDKLSNFHKSQLEEIRLEYENKASEQNVRFEETLHELKEAHGRELDALKKENDRKTENLSKEFCKKLLESSQKEENSRQRLEEVQNEYDALKAKSDEWMSQMTKDARLKHSMQECGQMKREVDSLRCVLELRSTELIELRRQSQVWQRDAEQLPSALGKITSLQTRLEELRARLDAKESNEQRLIKENKLLNETLQNECSQKIRLSMHNEELQWKLKQNSEVVQALAALTGPTASTPVHKNNRSSYALNKTASEADINNRRQSTGRSPPGSPVVKSVIEKNDSVSWVLDIDENPEVIATRILKRAQSMRCTPISRPPSLQPRGRNRSSHSLCMTSPGSMPASQRNKSLSPSSETMPKSPDSSSRCDSESVDSWTEENVTEEVIVVKNVDQSGLFELFNVDDSEIDIEDVPIKVVTAPAADVTATVDEMLEEVERRCQATHPKDAAGEAMISGEASDDEDDDDDDDEDDDCRSVGIDSDSRSDEFNDDLASSVKSKPQDDVFNPNLDLSWSDDPEAITSEG